jgi:hypothetical protein
MSVVSDILDRLSGVAVVKAELEQTAKRMDRLGDLVLNHETRIARIEGAMAGAASQPPAAQSARKRLPKSR